MGFGSAQGIVTPAESIPIASLSDVASVTGTGQVVVMQGSPAIITPTVQDGSGNTIGQFALEGSAGALTVKGQPAGSGHGIFIAKNSLAASSFPITIGAFHFRRSDDFLAACITGGNFNAADRGQLRFFTRTTGDADVVEQFRIQENGHLQRLGTVLNISVDSTAAAQLNARLTNLGVLTLGANAAAAGASLDPTGLTGIKTFTFPNSAVTPVLVTEGATQTLTNKTLSAPTLSGTAVGTYTLGGVPTLGSTITFADAVNIVLGTITGTKIGTATTQKLGFYNAVPVAQQAGVADAVGGVTIDAEARTAINTLISRIETLGLIATI